MAYLPRLGGKQGRRGRIDPDYVLFVVAICVLLGIAVWAYMVERHMNVIKHQFSSQRFESMMERADVAVAALGDRLAFEGLVNGYEGIFASTGTVHQVEITPVMKMNREAVQPGGLRLTGIIWGEAPLAFVNGKLVGVNEAVDGVSVVRIEPERITVADDQGERRVIELYRK